MAKKDGGNIMMLTNETYDRLKWVTCVVLPRIGTLYFALATIWGVPYGEQVVGTCTALAAFFGYVLTKSSSDYQGDGTLVVDTSDPEKDIYSIVLPDYPEKLADQDTVVLRVQNSTEG